MSTISPMLQSKLNKKFNFSVDSKQIFITASEQGSYHHFKPMLQPNWTKIITLNANTQEIVTLDS